MLGFQLLKNHAGILLTGDYDSLRVARETVSSVSEQAVTVKDKEGWLMGLAYDLRKAHDGQRKTLKPPSHSPGYGVRYGVEILWPVILSQYAMLRTGLGFVKSSAMDQAVAFNLQQVLEDGLWADFGIVAAEIMTHWNTLWASHADFEDKVEAPCGLFCAMNKAERKKHLPMILASMSPMYATHYNMLADSDPEFYAYSPADIAEWNGAEWPDPKW